ncbi:unnamed protein product, partial [marine sediment metagenome]
MIEQAQGVSQAGQTVGLRVPVLLKINTNAVLGGFSRFGVLSGEPALNLAKKLRQLPGIEFVGIYAHELSEDKTAEGVDKMAFETASLMTETARMLREEGIPIAHVSVGASSAARSTCHYIREGKFPEITEIHPGSFAIGDIMYMR